MLDRRQTIEGMHTRADYSDAIDELADGLCATTRLTYDEAHGLMSALVLRVSADNAPNKAQASAGAPAMEGASDAVG